MFFTIVLMKNMLVVCAVVVRVGSRGVVCWYDTTRRYVRNGAVELFGILGLVFLTPFVVTPAVERTLFATVNFPRLRETLGRQQSIGLSVGMPGDRLQRQGSEWEKKEDPARNLPPIWRALAAAIRLTDKNKQALSRVLRYWCLL